MPLSKEREQEIRAYADQRLGRDPWVAIGYVEELLDEITWLRGEVARLEADYLRAEEALQDMGGLVARLEAAGDRLAHYMHVFGPSAAFALANWREVRGQSYPDADTTIGEQAECPPHGDET